MKWKDLSLKERKQIYDSVRVNNPGATYFDIKEQFDSIPAYEDGGKSIVDEVNKSDANFVQRLKSPTRQTIPNWEDQYRVLPWEKSVSTHKLSVWDNANGGGIIVPDVQEVNGKLIDFTRPPYNNRAAVENALKTGDYVDLPKFEDALWYTENYKRYYPRFEDGGKNKNVPVLPKELGLTPGTPEYLDSSAELRKMGLFDAAGSRSYLLNPTEAKSHMLTLKRSLKDSGKITNWSTPVDENMILEYMRNPTSNKMVKNQYDLYRNKNEYIDRLNKLIPMEILMPLGGAGFVGHELNKE